jgi:S1-C subfamily serine protease
MKKVILLVLILLAFLGGWSILTNSVPNILTKKPIIQAPQKVTITSEESVVTAAVKEVGPSVVTVVENIPASQRNSLELGPFSVFGFGQEAPSGPRSQDIGSGFIVSKEGLLVTNKHVVSDASASYEIVTSDEKKYKVSKIYRDPLNDVAILKIDPGEHSDKTLKPVVLGDSSNLQVGQFVIAIGTALGEFRNTVTTGVISGLGRGITAGSAFEGYAEKLDNVIQTDAAINPGNSGGPLLNSSSQVIGVNTAVASGGQNIGFALPVNVIKESLSNFNNTGQFNRPYLGVGYRSLSSEVANLNNVPSGAYVETVVSESPADKIGLTPGDIIIRLDGKRVDDKDNELALIIQSRKVGDTIGISYWRDGKTTDTKVTLGAVPGQ